MSARELLYSGTIKGKFPLIKFQSDEIIKRTINGSFFMNSLKYYRDKYEKERDEFIGDPCEGMIFISEKLGATVKISKLNSHKECVFKQNLNNTAIPTPNSNDFSYCMFSVDPQLNGEFRFSEEQREKITSVYDTALIITSVDEYLDRIRLAALDRKIDIKCGFVKYYDECLGELQLFENLMRGTENILYYKRKKYSIQQEFRFTASNPQNKMNFELNIGDISQISHKLTSKEVIDAIISQQKNNSL